jgi:hypothetical protein
MQVLESQRAELQGELSALEQATKQVTPAASH